MTAHAHHLGTGLAGTFLRRAVLAHSDGAWEAAHRVARDVSTQLATAHPDDASLYCGAPALAYALHTAGHPAYRSALETLDETVAGLVRTKLAAARERMATGQPPRMREYDLISGLTGLGAYLLHRRTHPELLEYLLRYIVRLLLQPVTVGGRAVPGWWTSDSPNGQPDQAWPYGHGNFGLAHGVAGPVALLALCARAGFRVPRQQHALVHACRLLEQWSSSIPAGGTAWPETVTADRWQQGHPPPRLRAGPHGATAPQASPAPCNWPPSPATAPPDDATPNTLWPPASPTPPNSAHSTTRLSATAGRGSLWSSPRRPPTPLPAARSQDRCLSCVTCWPPTSTSTR
ncbi:hypothetical protein SVIO_040170 [Streptomyces violaceusniger]|uniref:Lanthionine synthetase C family protein n=1 Tax=Streptomyces violaceusniger TaxID=68280 RepID=A0A4D4KYY4_STRVO|nr:hypothetical protein SVIO_040170 [Streptomyces violaceusniger]